MFAFSNAYNDDKKRRRQTERLRTNGSTANNARCSYVINVLFWGKSDGALPRGISRTNSDLVKNNPAEMG